MCWVNVTPCSWRACRHHDSHGGTRSINAAAQTYKNINQLLSLRYQLCCNSTAIIATTTWTETQLAMNLQWHRRSSGRSPANAYANNKYMWRCGLINGRGETTDTVNNGINGLHIRSRVNLIRLDISFVMQFFAGPSRHKLGLQLFRSGHPSGGTRKFAFEMNSIIIGSQHHITILKAAWSELGVLVTTVKWQSCVGQGIVRLTHEHTLHNQQPFDWGHSYKKFWSRVYWDCTSNVSDQKVVDARLNNCTTGDDK